MKDIPLLGQLYTAISAMAFFVNGNKMEALRRFKQTMAGFVGSFVAIGAFVGAPYLVKYLNKFVAAGAEKGRELNMFR